MPHLEHFAINAESPEAALRFYERVFGWKFEPWGPPGFYRVDGRAPDGPGVTAAVQQRRELRPGHPTNGFECTIGVADIDLTTAAVTEAGGQILHDRATIPGVGHLAWFLDNSGNVFGAMQYDANAR